MIPALHLNLDLHRVVLEVVLEVVSHISAILIFRSVGRRGVGGSESHACALSLSVASPLVNFTMCR